MTEYPTLEPGQHVDARIRRAPGTLRPLVICQAVDEDDPVNPTLVRWLRALAAEPSIASIRVLTLRAGMYRLPDNVTVVPLGFGKLTRLVRFYVEVASAFRRRHADFFFIIQSGPYPAMLWPIKLVSGRRIYQWWTHSNVSRSMAFYGRWVDDLVFTATARSFPVDLPNVRVIGHAIDLDLFRPVRDDAPMAADMLAVGRLSAVKRLDALIRAVAACRETTGRKWSLDLCGPALEGDVEHRAALDDLVSDLEMAESVRFIGSVVQDEMPALLGRYRIAVSFSDGGLDKAIAEAMACGKPVVSTNGSFADLLPHDLHALLVVDHQDVGAQSRGITRILEMEEPEQAAIGQRLRSIIAEHHALSGFWGKVLTEIERSGGPGRVRPSGEGGRANG
jgi:glycosyltransferase involved in cell wall biosynthesis